MEKHLIQWNSNAEAFDLIILLFSTSLHLRDIDKNLRSTNFSCIVVYIKLISLSRYLDQELQNFVRPMRKVQK